MTVLVKVMLCAPERENLKLLSVVLRLSPGTMGPICHIP